VEDLTARRVAVVCVHGVASHPRYEFQDQVSGLLRDNLNDMRGGDDTWVVDVINPGNVLDHGSEEPMPTISRVHRRTDADPASPEGSFFDVMEAYWSPISKGATNWLWVVNWILKVVFAPLNTTASYNATWQKQFFDYGYIGGALLVAFGLFFVSLSAVWQSFVRVLTVTGLIKNTNANELINTLNTNANVPIPGGVPVKIVVWLFVGIIGGFLVGQALSAIWKLIVQRRALRHNPKAISHRVIAILVLAALGGGCITAMAHARFPNGVLGSQGVLFLILIFVAFQLGYALLIGFMVGFFGDVQVYTTRDENDSRFYGMRDRILDVTAEAMMRAISPQLNGGRRYDRVIILAHSLGATIAMDALTRLYQLSEQGAVTGEEFDRIRAFITAGSSLEKTRYFFDVSGASPTASFEHWRNDAYGSIFTKNPKALDRPNGHGIFWANYWYFQDPLCNEIRSYRSYLKAGESLESSRVIREEREGQTEWMDGSGGRPICWNERGHKHVSLTHWLLHSDYLNDPWFWRSYQRKGKDHIGALDIITSHVEGVYD
jgi:hypothetical protein